MKDCPSCRTLVSDDATKCTACGRDFSIASSLKVVKAHFKNLEREIALLEQLATGAPHPQAAPTPPPKPVERPVPERPVVISPPPRPAQKAPEFKMPKIDMESKLGQRGLLVVGVIIFVFGVGYFLKYSFDQNWVGPAARVAMAYLTGMAFLGVGEFFRRRKLETFGLYLLGGGVATLYFSTYAGFQIYHILDQAAAFGLMVLTTALACTLAVFYDTKWLAVLGLLGGFLTPILLGTGVDSQVVLMSYMMILNAGILSVASVKRWDLLHTLGFIATWVVFSGWYAKFYNVEKFWTTTLFINLFFLTFAIVPFLYYLVKKRSEKVTGFGIAMPNAFIAFGYSYATITGYTSLPAVALVSVSYAAVFLYMASYLYRRDDVSSDAFVMLLGKALLFLIISVPVLVSKHWITVFWSAQVITLIWICARLKNRALYRSGLILLALVLGKLYFYDYDRAFGLHSWSSTFRDGYFSTALERWLTAGSALAALFLTGTWVQRAGASLSKSGRTPKVAYAFFGLLLFLSLNFEVSGFFNELKPSASFAATSVLWALFSVCLMALGFAKDLSVLRKCALVLFGLTILKVFLADMANVSTPFRIISFMVLGVMLIGASYLYHRYKPTGPVQQKKEK